MRRRILLIGATVVVVFLVVSQLAIPPIAGSRIEDRLTEGGGTADVNVSAVPAVRLLFGDGGRLEATGAGLDLQPEPSDPVIFDKLDGFGEVDVDLASLRAGPFDVRRFRLTRDGDAPYTLQASMTTTGAQLADFGAGQVGLPNGPLLRFLTGQLPGAGVRIPIDLDMQLDSDDGRLRVVSGGGAVAGIPTGPLAALITSLVVVRL